MINIDKFNEFTEINEDGSGGAVGGGAVGGGGAVASGVATANGGTTGGMGNVVSAQPSSTPGAAVTGNGTTGSGDVSYPSKYSNTPVYSKNSGIKGDKFVKLSKEKGSKKKNKFITDVKKMMNDRSGEKIKSFSDFNTDSIEKVTKVKQ